MWYSVGCSRQNYHHYKTDYLCQITTTTKYVFYLFRVRVGCVPFAVAGVLRWINTYYLCAVCRVSAW